MQPSIQLFTHFHYINTKNCQLEQNQSMVIADGKIIWRGTQIPHTLHIGDTTIQNLNQNDAIDLQRSYIMPGMINVHCHIAGSGKKLPKFLSSPTLTKILKKTKLVHDMIWKTMVSNVEIALERGITTLRSLGDPFDSVAELQAQINAEKIRGARLIHAGKVLAYISGHNSIISYPIASIAEASTAILHNKALGAGWIKIMVTGAVTGSKQIDEYLRVNLDLPLIKHIVQFAHENKMRVAAHCENPQGAYFCGVAGIDTLEHGADFDTETVHLFKEKGIALIPTLSAGEAYDQPRKLTGLSKIEKVNNDQVKIQCDLGMRHALSANLFLGAGTDAGIPLVRFQDFYREVVLLNTRYDIQPFKCLQIATYNNAVILGKDNSLGCLDPGHWGDFLVFKPEHNPLDDLANLQYPDQVFRNGQQLFSRPLSIEQSSSGKK